LTGCAGLQACASGLTTIVEGMTLEQAKEIDVEQIIAFLGSLPPRDAKISRKPDLVDRSYITGRVKRSLDFRSAARHGT
jgi:NifU-like protein involved in Fe-S cluster formation